jgi:predicted dienelactone hydrolase
VLRRFGQIDTHAIRAAALAPRQGPWPVVIFSPGYGAPRAFYTGLATALASRGFVVLALDHPYEVAVTQLADGRVVGPQEHFLPNDPDRTQYMAGQQVVRAADVIFVLDQIARPGVLGPQLSGRIDTARVAVIGHSFGGAAAAAAMDQDPRVVAAANLDGTPYGALPTRVLKGPFLVVQSDYAETHHSQAFIQGNAALLRNATAPSFHYEIKRANHFSFTDAPLFFSPPGRWLLARLIGGARGPVDTQHASADILAAFLAGPLTGAPGDVPAAAARYREVVAKPISRTATAAPTATP